MPRKRIVWAARPLNENQKFLAWFNPGGQPQAQFGDGKAPKAAQSSPNHPDLRLPHTIEPKISVARNLTYLNPANLFDNIKAVSYSAIYRLCLRQYRRLQIL